jgi:hypothetical protein
MSTAPRMRQNDTGDLIFQQDAGRSELRQGADPK